MELKFSYHTGDKYKVTGFRKKSSNLSLIQGSQKKICNKGGFEMQGSMDATELQSPLLQSPFGKPRFTAILQSSWNIIFARTMIYSLRTPYSIYFSMVISSVPATQTGASRSTARRRANTESRQSTRSASAVVPLSRFFLWALVMGPFDFGGVCCNGPLCFFLIWYVVCIWCVLGSRPILGAHRKTLGTSMRNKSECQRTLGLWLWGFTSSLLGPEYGNKRPFCECGMLYRRQMVFLKATALSMSSGTSPISLAFLLCMPLMVVQKPSATL